jgi:sigma-B regulation protein RsbU (phosphoserine phosphatase)
MATRVEGGMNAPEPVAPQTISERIEPTSSRKILLIESEQDQSIYWDAVFRSLGFQVLNAASLEAADPLLAKQPSIIACSSLVSDGTGVEFFAHLRRRPELALVYLVLLTSSGEEVISSLRAGANDCIDMSAPYGEIRARLELAERVISLNEALHHKSAALGEALTLIQTELQSAGRLQAAMLPKALDHRSFQIRTLYQPSDVLGGDMIGLMPVAGDRFAFGLIDVVGHGTASALISCSLIREMMDRMVVVLQGSDPETWRECGRVVIEELNRRYCRLDLPGMYFTALAGVLDTRQWAVSYCQAGHPNLICFDPDQGWNELQDSGYPIGLLEEAEYASRMVPLMPGQMLLAVSDGFLRPQTDDPEGSRELLRVVRKSSQQAEQILERLARFAAQLTGPERDDQSAMLIRCNV